jgi:phosphatidylglycerophosphatase A
MCWCERGARLGARESGIASWGFGVERSRSLSDWLSIAVATGFGLGFSPIMPGTVGAILGLPLAFGVAHLVWPIGQLAAIVVLFLIGVPICATAARALGGKKDPGSIVWDEIASLPIVTLGFAPERLGVGDFAAADWRIYAAAFVLHRIFDITKPPPAGRAEKLPGGWGIMADDAVAAMMACACLHAADWLGAFQ